MYLMDGVGDSGLGTLKALSKYGVILIIMLGLQQYLMVSFYKL